MAGPNNEQGQSLNTFSYKIYQEVSDTFAGGVASILFYLIQQLVQSNGFTSTYASKTPWSSGKYNSRDSILKKFII